MTEQELVQSALTAREQAYAPYSNYQVGAALLTEDGKIFTGCNIENASYGATNCAERTAFFKAISVGERRFTALAIAGGLENKPVSSYAFPCGICRQVMQEFCSPDFRVFIVKKYNDFQVYTLEQLLPFGFGGENIV